MEVDGSGGGRWALILNVYLYWTCPFIRHTDKEDRLMLSLLFGSVIAVLTAGIALFLWTPRCTGSA